MYIYKSTFMILSIFVTGPEKTGLIYTNYTCLYNYVMCIAISPVLYVLCKIY